MKQTFTKTYCDITGVENAVEHRFTYRGTEYAIDLSAAKIAEFDELMAPFVEKARRVAGARGAKKFSRPATPVKAPTASNGNGNGTHAPTSGASNDDIRAWAKQKGIPVADRGRIGQSLREQYEAENGATAKPVAKETAPAKAAPAKAAPAKAPKPGAEEIAAVWSQGHSYEALADAFNITTQTAKKWVNGLSASVAA